MTYPPPQVPPANSTAPALEEADNGQTDGKARGLMIGAAIAAVVVVAGLLAAAVWLVQNPDRAASVRDVFIIFMALEFMLVGVALVVLVVQLAVLTNMLQHEIKPILESTSETLNTVRGTTAFLSENLVDPVIKMNSALAAMGQVLETINVFGRYGRKK